MISVNLIPAEVLLARARRKHICLWSTAAGVAALAVAFPLALEWMNRASAAELRAQSQRLEGELTSLRSEFQQTSAQAAAVLGQIERAKALRSKRAWSALLAMIGNCLPDDVWLTSIATDPPAPSGSGGLSRPLGGRRAGKLEKEKEAATVTIDAPRRLKIAGYSLDHGPLYDFMARLKMTSVFTEVALMRSGVERFGDGSAIGFELTCAW